MVLFRVCGLILKMILFAALTTWAAAAPLVWIVRDGLGPDMVETSGAQAVFKFAVSWGLPALVLAVPLFGLMRIERWLAKADRSAMGRGE